MRLYHFTSEQHLPVIEAEGLLRPSESNVGAPWHSQTHPSGDNAGPQVVWLLDTPEPAFDHGLSGSVVDKTVVRFTVDLPEQYAVRWLDWAPAAAMDPMWRESLVERAGGEEAAAHWYIFPAPIRAGRWIEVAILNPKTGVYMPYLIGDPHE